jgi:hypothetical protein
MVNANLKEDLIKLNENSRKLAEDLRESLNGKHCDLSIHLDTTQNYLDKFLNTH